MITFVTSWYQMKAKFPSEQYKRWMVNLLSNVVEFNLVVYTEKSSMELFKNMKKNGKSILDNKKIKMIIKPLEQLYNYKYKEEWIKNHKKNKKLNKVSEWPLNMLWSEKTYFVYETVKKKYFDTDFYGWCDIGYFRGRTNDINNNLISKWPNPEKIEKMRGDFVWYGLAQKDWTHIGNLYNNINKKDPSSNLPIPPIWEGQVSVAGGFFVTEKHNVEWWWKMFDKKLQLYFKHDYLVKDDQIIIADCIFSKDTSKKFRLVRETKDEYDSWFLFQRFLL